MKLTGKIKNADGILVTDPYYLCVEDLCYKRDIEGTLNPVISIRTHKEKATYEGKQLNVSTTDLDMLLSRGNLISLRKKDNALLYSPEISIYPKSVCVDTARLYVGSLGGYSPEYALLTGGDGQFGETVEFTIPGPEGTTYRISGEMAYAGWYGVAIRLSFPSDVIAENELLQSLVAEFHIEDIKNTGI